MYHVVLGLEIGQAQLAGLREPRLEFSVEKNFRAVLPGNDQEGAEVAGGADGRLGGAWLIVSCLIISWLIVLCLIWGREFSGGGVGGNG